jgi:hypothetical protein
MVPLACASNPYSVDFTMSTIWRRRAFDPIFAEHRAAEERALYARYKPDDARDTTVALHRLRNPAANHAAEAVVIYDLQRDGRYLTDVGPILKPAVSVAASGGTNAAFRGGE